MKKQFLRLALLAVVLVTTFSACNKEKGENNEEEVITNVRVIFSPASGGGVALPAFEFNDPDGPGGVDPVIDNIVLPANGVYNVSIQVLNNGTLLNDEIITENRSHRFYYVVSAGNNITVSDEDVDFDGVTLGLNSKWTIGAAGNGSVRLVLRHYADGGKEEGDPVDSPKSSSDIDITFPTMIN